MNKYQICTFCVMDKTDSEIVFDNDGVCNHCKKTKEILSREIIDDETKRNLELEKLVKKIKEDGKNKKYDCLIGISGGVDSTYVAYKAKEFGLRPLAVHLDNGWNSKLSISNIEKTIKKLNIDLYTHTLDWEEFKNLQRAFLEASVPDLEIPTDHAINAILRSLTIKYKIKYFIIGSNIKTESIMPRTWSYGHYDWGYIKYINKHFGKNPLKTFPHITFYDRVLYRIANNLKVIRLLDFTNYSKENTIELLKEKLEWQYYGGKHYESIYTRFVQGYVLPEKFNIDKRRAHLSAMIASNEISREVALEELAIKDYPEKLMLEDKNFVIDKLNMTEEEFGKIMSLRNKTFWDYSSDENSFKYRIIKNLYNMVKK